MFYKIFFDSSSAESFYETSIDSFSAEVDFFIPKILVGSFDRFFSSAN